MKLLLPFIICCALISSCTVEKRLYNKGFHVEWTKKMRTADKIVSQDDEQDTDAQPAKLTASESPVSIETVAENVITESTEQAIVLQDVPGPGHENMLNENAFPVPLKDTVYIDDSGTKLEPVGIASAIAFVAAALSFQLPLAAVPYIGLFLFAAAFILSIVSMIRYALYRDYYKNNVLGVLTFILCLLTILVFAILIIALIAFF